MSLALRVSIFDKKTGTETVVPFNNVYNIPNLYDESTKCGSNNYFYKNNTIQYVIVNDPNCVVRIA